ncbi:hypothetical protein Trydic_g20755 [Trypoxylus dichotomus]
MKEKCGDTEELQRKNDMYYLHKEIKKTTYGSRRKSNMLEASDGRIICKEGEKLQEWERYIQEMFGDERHLLDAKNDYIEEPDRRTLSDSRIQFPYIRARQINYYSLYFAFF